MSSAAQHDLIEIRRPPEPGFALTYLHSLPSHTTVPERRSPVDLLRSALVGVAIQLMLAATVLVVTLVFLEDLHAE
jgi:hypothetical protein